MTNSASEEVKNTIEDAAEMTANNEIKINVGVDKKKVEEAEKVLKETFDGLKKKMDSISAGIKKAMGSMVKQVKSATKETGEMITEAFTITSLEEYEEAAERFGTGLADALYSVHENMDSLETAIVDAVAPIASVAVPIINGAVLCITDLVNGMGQVIGGVFGGVTAIDTLAESAETAKENASGAANLLPGTVNDTVSPQIAMIVDKIQSLLVPITAIDLTPVTTAFSGLQAALIPLTQDLFAGLEWAYLNLFVPLASWTTESLLPGFLGLISGALRVMDEVITALQPLALWLWDSFLQPMAEWTGGVIIDALQWLAEKLVVISEWIAANQSVVAELAFLIGSIVAVIGGVNAAVEVWNVISAVGVVVTSKLGAAMTFLISPIGLVIVAITALIAIVVLLVQNWDTVKATVLNVWEAIKNALGAAWQWLKSTLLDPLVNGFKSVINGIIGFINGMIAGAVKGINGIINVLNKLQFSVPDWVPGLGGMTLGFDLKPVTAPQIPYLAQGAVLPANRPFLAVVGDQRHGTNVEAPLATIQEAVAVVIDDYIGAMMAGFEALLAEQKATRQAVESIHIGDDVLYKAVQRRSRVMAIARGGL